MKSFEVYIRITKSLDFKNLKRVIQAIDRLVPDIQQDPIAIAPVKPAPKPQESVRPWQDDAHRNRLAVGKMEAAKFLSVSTKTIERLILSGKLPAFKLGWQWRIRLEEIDAYMKRLEEQTRRMTSGSK